MAIVRDQESQRVIAPPTEAAAAVQRPRVALGLLAVACAVIVSIAALDRALTSLNEQRLVLPRFDVRYVPYHDARFTRRHEALTRYARTPDVIFTGDSRTMSGLNPEVVAWTLGVAPERFFNFGTGAQGVSFARRALLPHLVENGWRPRYLVFGVTPDWVLNRSSSDALVKMYQRSMAYRLAHRTSEDGDGVEWTLRRFLAHHSALYRYRADLLGRELLLQARCVVSECVERYENAVVPVKDLDRAENQQTRFGWDLPVWEWMTTGEFRSPRRFDEGRRVEGARLHELIHAVRSEGITPIFVIMPVHPTFALVHTPALERVWADVETVARDDVVAVVRPQRTYADAKNFVDGHHLSSFGAARLSADVGTQLARFLDVDPRTQARAR